MGPGLRVLLCSSQARILEGGARLGCLGPQWGWGWGWVPAQTLVCPLGPIIAANLPAKRITAKSLPEAALLIQPCQGWGGGLWSFLVSCRTYCPALCPCLVWREQSPGITDSPPASDGSCALSLRHWGACGGMCRSRTQALGLQSGEKQGWLLGGGSGPFLSTSQDGCPSPPGGQSPWSLDRTLLPCPERPFQSERLPCVGERT